MSNTSVFPFSQPEGGHQPLMKRPFEPARMKVTVVVNGRFPLKLGTLQARLLRAAKWSAQFALPTGQAVLRYRGAPGIAHFAHQMHA